MDFNTGEWANELLVLNWFEKESDDQSSHSKKMKRKGWMERIALIATHWSGSSVAFILAAGVIVVWLVSGPLFGFSDTWQLVINTGTTIVTFLMVFLIQRSQNKEAVALQLKLNELVAAIEGARNRLINIEDLSEAEIATLHKHYN